MKSKVADTIGAGDSYMSALILGFLTRGTEGFAPAVLEQLGHTAAAAAAITVQRPGANPPTLEELNLQSKPIPRSPNTHVPEGPGKSGCIHRHCRRPNGLHSGVDVTRTTPVSCHHGRDAALGIWAQPARPGAKRR